MVAKENTTDALEHRSDARALPGGISKVRASALHVSGAVASSKTRRELPSSSVKIHAA